MRNFEINEHTMQLFNSSKTNISKPEYRILFNRLEV